MIEELENSSNKNLMSQRYDLAQKMYNVNGDGICKRRRSFSTIQKELFESEKKMYRSRFEGSISNWSKRESTGIKHNDNLNKFYATSLLTPTNVVNFENFKTTDKYLISPGKSNYAGLKPVFSNSSNMLKKNENHVWTTEHHLEFPYFIKNLPKTGLKNNLKEYKTVLTHFVRTDNKLNKDTRFSN